MADNNPQDGAEKLRQQIANLQAKLKKKQAAQKTKERKQDTRRCILAGRYILKHATLNPGDPISKKLVSLLDEYLIPDRTHTLAMINADRALYEDLGIKPLPPEVPANQSDDPDQSFLKPKFTQ
jgi:uncharacterized protein YukJ